MSPALAKAESPVFEVGQIWTLKPPLDGETRVRIGRIEDDGETIHISLWGLEAPVPQATDVLHSPLVMSHLPISTTALAASVQDRSDDPPPENLGFEEGYATWRADSGGVFTITVAEIVEAVLQTVRSGRAKQE